MEGENRLSAVNGCKESRDPRGESCAMEMLADQKSPRWTLAVSRWDYRIAAAEVLAALGKRPDAPEFRQ